MRGESHRLHFYNINMEKSTKSPVFRPNEADFNERVRYVRESKKTDPDAYKTYINEVPQYAQGESDPETRQQYYPGWTQEDFKTLQERLEEEGLI